MIEKHDVDKKRVAVIGGGSSGLMAAITARMQGAFVTIYERNERLGKKILVTGNGKCNFTNEDMRAECFYSSELSKAWEMIQRFSTEDVLMFFHKLGVLYKERNGYYYPSCEQASVILDALRLKAEELNIRVCYEKKVSGIHKEDDMLCVDIAGEESALFDKVIVCTGGYAAPKTGSDGSGYKIARKLGHKIVPTHPALVQLRCEEGFLKQIAGVRADALITFYAENGMLCKERGELQITDYGISGIPVFQCSRLVTARLREQRSTKVVINFVPDYTQKEWEDVFEKRFKCMSERSVGAFCNGLLNKKLMQLFIKLCGLKEDSRVDTNRDKIRDLFMLCKSFTLCVTGSNGYDMAQVTAGGVSLSELTDDLESALVPGVYFAGEIVDVDGICGGYNLQWAWSSGYITGMHATKQMERNRDSN